MPVDVRARLLEGLAIPAHPLALTADRRLDERRQRALTRYYIEAGVGGVAVGVHTTQFGIHDPSVGLYEPVLSLAASTVDEYEADAGARGIVRIAGVIGETGHAAAEARLASELGYQVALVSFGGLDHYSIARLIDHVRAIGEIMPVMGFYLQSAVGGRDAPLDLWRRMAELEQLVAVKIAPFDRYKTHDVIRAVVEAGRADEVALYTGNDDHIILDLLTPHRIGGSPAVHMVGGLLGQWSVWTRRAVELHHACREIVQQGGAVPHDLLATAAQLTDANGAIFDATNGYAGCLPGIHEILRRQGLLEGTWCLRSDETLSPGQVAEIDRVLATYPHLCDDEFVAEHRDRWLA